jgi:tetratricopeptide (TPR) repeat protein
VRHPIRVLTFLGASSVLLLFAAAPSSVVAQVPGAANAPAAKRLVADEAAATAEAVQRGDAAWQAGELDRAIYYYVLSMQRSSASAATLAKIGAIEEGRGNAVLAEKAFEMAHGAGPQEPRIAERLARLYLRRANVGGAADIYTQVLASNPQRSGALDGMGEVLLIRGEYGEAIGYFDRAMRAEKADTVTILSHRGYAKLLSNDMAGAGEDLRAALAIAPQSLAARYFAELQVRQGDTTGAFDSLARVMDAAHAYNEIGVLLMSVNNYRDAKEYFERAISASAIWYEEAQTNLAMAYGHLRKPTS